MKTLLYFFIFVIALLNLNCKNRTSINTNSDFDNYIKKIPQLRLPFYTSCGSCCPVSRPDLNEVLLQKFNPDNLEIVGKFIPNDSLIYILYAGGGDYLAPGLFVYDRKGNKISEQAFMGNLCGRSQEFYGNYHLEINKEFRIKETDSIFIFKLDSMSNSIIDTLKKEVKILEYEINEKGVIMKR